MKITLLALCFLCLSSLNVSAQSTHEVSQGHQDSSCEYDGKTYPIGASLSPKKKVTIICKVYDAIIPKSADKLIKGYAYWDKQLVSANANIELPRTLFSNHFYD